MTDRLWGMRQRLARLRLQLTAARNNATHLARELGELQQQLDDAQ